MIGIPAQLAITVLTRLSQDPKMIGRLLEELGPMPNLPTRTMGGKTFWTDIVDIGGWKLQKNRVFNNCRILDSGNVRRAWGSEAAMLKAFESLE
jgi:hypothetical protein